MTYTAVADADLGPSSPASALSGNATGTFFQSRTSTYAGHVAGLYVCGYKGAKRYLKVNVRMTGSHSTGSPYAVSFVASGANRKPNFTSLS